MAVPSIQKQVLCTAVNHTEHFSQYIIHKRVVKIEMLFKLISKLCEIASRRIYPTDNSINLTEVFIFVRISCFKSVFVSAEIIRTEQTKKFVIVLKFPAFRIRVCTRQTKDGCIPFVVVEIANRIKFRGACFSRSVEQSNRFTVNNSSYIAIRFLRRSLFRIDLTIIAMDVFCNASIVTVAGFHVIDFNGIGIFFKTILEEVNRRTQFELPILTRIELRRSTLNINNTVLFKVSAGVKRVFKRYLAIFFVTLNRRELTSENYCCNLASYFGVRNFASGKNIIYRCNLLSICKNIQVCNIVVQHIRIAQIDIVNSYSIEVNATTFRIYGYTNRRRLRKVVVGRILCQTAHDTVYERLNKS